MELVVMVMDLKVMKMTSGGVAMDKVFGEKNAQPPLPPSSSEESLGLWASM